jgi:predicted sugar kinase
MKIEHPTVLRDTLHNMAVGAGDSAEYARGVLLGVVGAFMAAGMSWAAAVKLASENAPKVVMAGSVPESWLVDFAVPASEAANKREWRRTVGRN